MSDNILVTAFDGEENSSRIILKKLSSNCKKIILPNHKQKSCEILKTELDSSAYRYVISLGQKPFIKNKISTEDTAKSSVKNNEKIISTNAENIVRLIRTAGCDCYISHNAGTSFCNNLYYYGLDYIERNSLDVKMIFLHVPFAENCDTDKIAECLDNVITQIKRSCDL